MGSACRVRRAALIAFWAMASLDTDLGQHPNRTLFWITSEAWDTQMFGLTTEKTRHTTLSQVILASG
jgi:hypothetical protein